MSNPVLILVDYQQAFEDLSYWGQRNNIDAESNATKVLAAFRKAKLPVIHVRHNSTSPTSILRPGQPGNDAMFFAAELAGEPVLAKGVNSGFIGTDLEARLKALNAHRVVIMGISTDHCVSTTTRMAANLGFQVALVGDACFTFDRVAPDGEIIPAEMVHRVELAILSGEFAEISQSARVIEQLG